MFLPEQPLERADQYALAWTLGRLAWAGEEEAQVAEGNFDTWWDHIMWMCVQLSVPEPRKEC